MSPDSKHGRIGSFRRNAIAVAVAAFLTVGFSSSAIVRAQDATPEASPAAECDAPEFVATGPSTPEAMAGMAMATPVPADAAAPADEGTPADEATAAAITAAAENLAGCINGGDYEGAVALMTSDFLQEQFDTTSTTEAVNNLQGQTFVNLVLTDPRTYEDGSVSIDAQYEQGEYQLVGEIWHFVQDGDYWKIDSLGHFTPSFDGDAAVVGVPLTSTKADDGTITYSIVPNTATVVQPEVLVLHGVNGDTVDHEIVVLKLPDGADPAGLLDGTIKESDVEFIGQISLAAGEEGDLVLQNLPAGVYTLACFFPAPDGAPHAAHGMISQIEVTAAP